MASGEEGVSSLGALSRNWRSALVVNSLHDALEESERERDQLAQILRCDPNWTYSRQRLVLFFVLMRGIKLEICERKQHGRTPSCSLRPLMCSSIGRKGACQAHL